MFRTEVESENGFLPWLLQQIAAPAIPFIWALLTASVPPALGTYAGTYTGQPRQIVFEIFWSLVIGWGLAFALAVAVRRLFPGAARSGKWVWLLPVLVFTLGVISDSMLFSLRKALVGLFYYGPHGEASWGFALITFPTCSCIMYSLGMYIADRRAVRKPRPAPDIPPAPPRPLQGVD